MTYHSAATSNCALMSTSKKVISYRAVRCCLTDRISAMSGSDGPIGASKRSDLFSSNLRTGRAMNPKDEHTPDDSNFIDHEDVDDRNPLQIEHIMGYTSDFYNTVMAAATNEHVYIKSLGCLILLENLSDSLDQKLLRGHDMEVSALCQSPSGRLIASGQSGTKSCKGSAAPIFVWQRSNGSYRRCLVLKGLSIRVNLVSISPDEKFLCGCGEDSLLYIWDISSGEVVYGQKTSYVVSVMKWAAHQKVRQYDEYGLVLGFGNLIWGGSFTFAPDRVQWGLKLSASSMPPGGNMMRTFTALDFSLDRVFAFVGTSGGEMMIFRRDTGVFRACVPVCSGGVSGIVTLPNDIVICSGGDGNIYKLEGRDMEWHVSQKVILDSSVNSLSLSANHSELLVGCSSGSVYRCLSSNLSSHVVSEGHTSPVACIAFEANRSGPGSENSSVFATGTLSGEIRMWDLTDYVCTAVCRNAKSGAVMCLELIDKNTILSGWSDGFIRCYDTRTLQSQLWYIANAHRGCVTSISCHIDNNSQFLASGGGDGAVRVWRLSNRELITQYTEHSKAVAKVLIDWKSPNIIHSAGRDSSVLSYDLRTNRRIMSHLMGTSQSGSGSSMTDMTQRIDNEQELITSDTQGRLLFWDIDYREHVHSVYDQWSTALQCCKVSPSGKYLAYSGDDQLLRILDLHSSKIVAVGHGHSSIVNAVAWTPDERQLVTGGNDMSLCVWNWYMAVEKQMDSRASQRDGRTDDNRITSSHGETQRRPDGGHKSGRGLR